MSIQEYIGDEKSSRLADDLEALTRIMPTLVLARMDAGKKDASRIEEAVEVVAMAIDNLRDVHSELFPY
jgi:hypothetical protein